MNWDKIELHVENLIPGLVVGGLVAGFAALPTPPTVLPDAVKAVLFVATSYLLGAVGNVLARLLVDTISGLYIRPLFVYGFLRIRGEAVTLARKPLNTLYSNAIDAGLTCVQPLVETEVVKRRVTGRLVRSSLVPVWVGLWVVGPKVSLSLVALMAGAYLAILVLYGYAELVLFQEARRGERLKAGTAPAAMASASELPAEAGREVTMPIDERARIDYEATLEYFHRLHGVRFKLLGLLPLASGAGVAVLARADASERVAFACLGVLITLGLASYDQRNTQIYDRLIERAKFLEKRFRFPSFPGRENEAGGPFHARPKLKKPTVVWHTLGLTTVYAGCLTAWAFLGIGAVVDRQVLVALLTAGTFLASWAALWLVCKSHWKDTRAIEAAVDKYVPDALEDGSAQP